MIEFKETIDEQRFDEFVAHHPYKHYQKTCAWGKYRVNYGGDISYHCLIAQQDNVIIASALMLITKRKGIGKVAYIPNGPCIDYDDESTVKEAFDSLIKVAKRYNVTSLKVDFNVKRVSHSIDGSVIEGENHENVTDLLTQMGFVHRGYGYAYDGSWANRFTLIAPIGIEKYEKTVQKSLMQAVNRQLKTGVIVRDGTDEDLQKFVDCAQVLGNKKSFTANSVSYFKHYIDALKPYSIFKVVEIDYLKRVDIYQQELQSSTTRKNPQLLASVEKHLQEAINDVNNGKTKDFLGGAIYMKLGDMIYDPYTYTHKDSNLFKAAACLHITCERENVSTGSKYLDFVGFAGNTDPKDPYYGLYDFKSKFNSEFVEYLGEFDYVYDPIRFYGDKFLRKLKKLLK